jgi:hypothetical protein
MNKADEQPPSGWAAGLPSYLLDDTPGAMLREGMGPRQRAQREGQAKLTAERDAAEQARAREVRAEEKLTPEAKTQARNALMGLGYPIPPHLRDEAEGVVASVGTPQAAATHEVSMRGMFVPT